MTEGGSWQRYLNQGGVNYIQAKFEFSINNYIKIRKI
jgi:hypothetical protein